MQSEPSKPMGHLFLKLPSLLTSRFIIYKTPTVTDQLNGLTYLYIDSTGAKERTPNNVLINSPTGILANTLKPLFEPVRQMVRWLNFFETAKEIVVCQVATTS